MVLLVEIACLWSEIFLLGTERVLECYRIPSAKKLTTAGKGIVSHVAPVWHLRFSFLAPWWTPKPIHSRHHQSRLRLSRNDASWPNRCTLPFCFPLLCLPLLSLSSMSRQYKSSQTYLEWSRPKPTASLSSMGSSLPHLVFFRPTVTNKPVTWRPDNVLSWRTSRWYSFAYVGSAAMHFSCTTSHEGL